jgi:hypothetical protein
MVNLAIERCPPTRLKSIYQFFLRKKWETSCILTTQEGLQYGWAGKTSYYGCTHPTSLAPMLS